jgi:hypothetical protein
MIRTDRERYLKHIVTDLETLYEPSSADFPVLGNYSCDSDFGNLSPFLSVCPSYPKLQNDFSREIVDTAEETLFCQEPTLEITELIGGEEESDKKEEADRFFPQVWTLYFDGSKSQEGSGVGCILIDPKGKRHFMSCRLEFECTNNIVEYEALVQGLKKAMDLNIKELKVFGVSEIIVRQVRNTIHHNSPHLRNYQ